METGVNLEQVQTGAEVPVVTQEEGVADQGQVQTSLSPDGGEGESQTTQVPQKKEEEAGLLETVKAERERRQNEAEMRKLAEDKASFLERKLRAIEQERTQADPLLAIADDEYVDGVKLKSIIQSIRQESKQRDQISRVQYSTEVARNKYADYDKAIEYFDKFATETEKYIVLTSRDPAERAYRYGKSHPDFQKTIVADTAKTVLDNVNKHVNTQKTLSNAGGGGFSEDDAVKKIQNMSDEDFDKEFNRIMYGGK